MSAQPAQIRNNIYIYRGHIGVIQGISWGPIGIMEEKMETAFCIRDVRQSLQEDVGRIKQLTADWCEDSRA